MHKTHLSAGALVVILVGVFVALGVGEKTPLQPTHEVQGQEAANTTPVTPSADRSQIQEREAADPRSVRVLIGDAVYVGVVPNGSTVLEAMRQLQQEGLEFEGREYPSLGFFVESINGKENADGNYWFLYVSGKSSDAGASQTRLQAGDIVEWRYQKRQ